MSPAYKWYLGSAFWRERSEYILRRANYICEKCGTRRATEMHHLTYKRVFQEDPSDCSRCAASAMWKSFGGSPRTSFQALRLSIELIACRCDAATPGPAPCRQ